MATILEFRSSGRTQGPVKAANGKAGEIVFFPGVRYERWGETKAQKSRRRLKQKKRDMIEVRD